MTNLFLSVYSVKKKREIPPEFYDRHKDFTTFMLLLRKGVTYYVYIVSLRKFNERSLPGKDKFFSELNYDEISNSAYRQAQRVQNKFIIKNKRVTKSI